jgi:hypothetical protein
MVSQTNPRGAGRKPANPQIKKNSIHLKLEQYILDWLDEQPESRAVIIANALREKYDIQPPTL